ncbi:MAG: hypothetical protein M3R24_03080, partial [Chloroflexota bacterium]|nr:hypothetical protein [Chloroflexota bacterium]
CNAIEHLGQANIIAVLLEPEGAPDDVQERLEFSTTELYQELVKEFVWYRSKVRGTKPTKSKGLRGISVFGHIGSSPKRLDMPMSSCYALSTSKVRRTVSINTWR